MFALFAEGLETAFFPCSLVLAVPSIAIALGGRRYSAAGIGMFIVGLISSSWLRFAGFSEVWPSIFTGVALLAAAAVLVRPLIKTEAISTATAGLVAGAATGTLWRPCVGFEFGEALTAMNTSGPAGVVQLTIYVFGVMAPIIALTAVATALPPAWIERAKRPLLIIGSGVLAVMGVAVIAGLDDRVINRLFELSSF